MFFRVLACDSNPHVIDPLPTNEATQNKCNAFVLGFMALLAASMAFWMFSCGDTGYTSGICLVAVSIFFILGSIIAAVRSVQKKTGATAPIQVNSEKVVSGDAGGVIVPLSTSEGQRGQGLLGDDDDEIERKRS